MPRYRSDDDAEEDEEHIPFNKVWCEMCQHAPCQCDRDPNNPVDCSKEFWQEMYSDPDYNLDDDHSMDA